MKWLDFVILLVLFAALMTETASATIVEQKRGPYDVNFDLTNTSTELNSSASEWHKQSVSGRIILEYEDIYVIMKNKPEICVANIHITHSDSGINVNSRGYAENLRDSGWENVQTYSRTIDGHDGIVTTGDSPNGSIYWASYEVDSDTLVEIDSRMPMDKGTGDMLNTIHVGRMLLSYSSENESVNSDL